MQQNKKNLGEKCYIAVTGIIWISGLLIAGSENNFMPWVNGAGLILFLISSILLGKFFRQLESSGNLVMFPGVYQHPRLHVESSEKKNCRVSCRYIANIR
ncbi:MAG: hypothetical protein KKE62_13520 [Proteobacteria bacterium]|nr:hypothetical protein [Pseudomonadota bacterium]MBU1389841.1 hypothetical protein [Pseudomonadota bacterium]MBU1543850.1 hypothetical protein [Pseudomonadota bacterium]MBU2481133.1 hypothetical protein [Pseudomonadota bacterium]